ncbi:MAG: tRNA (guanosine(46)-N7)-methyltransferase TrmB [Steroidobacteraceae bacterium]
MNDVAHRAIRSFVIRAGRITDAQERALSQSWPVYGLDFAPAPLDLDALFGRHAPRSLEIGFGNGDHLAALAASRVDTDYIGIEVHRPGVGALLLSAERLQLRNLRAICHDAVEVLQHQIAAGALDEVLLLFPDPWPKKRHNKRRIVNAEFTELVASRLRPGGVFRLATDWEPYAEHMLETLRASASFTNEATTDYVERPAHRDATRFERRGTRLGHGIRDLAFRRR